MTKLFSIVFAGFLASGAAHAQASWQEFPGGQSRVEFSALGLAAKPSRGWELSGGTAAKSARNYQYLWNVPFQGKAAFARVYVAQIRQSSTYFTAPPQWEKLDEMPEFANRPANLSSHPVVPVKTDGLGVMNSRRFQAGGRECITFGGLTNAGAGSQLLYGEAMASGDTSVRGHICAAEGTAIGDADVAAVMGALKFR